MIPTKIISAQSAGLVKSSARVLEVFELFYETRRPLRAIDIGNALGFPKSSTIELLKTLVETGYLTFDSEEKIYFPSFRLIRFGKWLSDHYFDGNRVNDLLQYLHEKTGLSTALSMQNDRSMQFLAILQPADHEAAKTDPNLVSEGLKMPIVGSAAGSALLMSKSDHDVRAIYARAVGLRVESVPKDEINYILELVKKFRRRGYATNFRAVVPEVSSVAIPLPRRAGGTQLVIGYGTATLKLTTAMETELSDLLRHSISCFMN